ncbi:hypothetical protein NE237_014341 [Protea cynaroides]|uniref:Uncharacterized protein n=1 Tax=Protea cynaroides TaxID=273540 RepID=A0A9Q0KBZ0_9MAGN|nr:hypothetical protein NE237_014341 [Protea cynaroides]
MPARDAVSWGTETNEAVWNALISGMAQRNPLSDALSIVVSLEILMCGIYWGMNRFFQTQKHCLPMMIAFAFSPACKSTWNGFSRELETSMLAIILNTCGLTDIFAISELLFHDSVSELIVPTEILDPPPISASELSFHVSRLKQCLSEPGQPTLQLSLPLWLQAPCLPPWHSSVIATSSDKVGLESVGRPAELVEEPLGFDLAFEVELKNKRFMGLLKISLGAQSTQLAAVREVGKTGVGRDECCKAQHVSQYAGVTGM